MDEIRSDTVFTGNVAFGGATTLPANSIGDTQANPGSPLGTSKTIHRHAVRQLQADGADVASQTTLAFLARAACTIIGAQIRLSTAPTGGNKQFTVDVKKASSGSVSFSSILSAAVTIDNTRTNGQVITATLSGTPTLAAGDAVQVVITASGSTGSQGQGVLVQIAIDENPS
jgi:hypothetical protein